ncbi:Vesicle transport through interaction with t-SNAREs 1B [Desmophyllum pertusum]|uniref:Vesicle transport through interaction with t-SNAREs 1B n=1 Tax=Desmophyllum pertusum TaxID=174260 RepID=A0A9W9ZFB5_9CNID|nr:Vesicle transport through interaction with t-SNAREs 1B [Desmophyllum pertusum]
MSSEKFEDLEDELKGLHEDISGKINNKIPKLSGELRKSTVREVEKKIEDANLIIEEMEEEAGTAPATYRNSMMSRIRSYRRDFDKLKRDLGKPSGQVNVSFGRDELFDADPMAAQKNKVRQGTDTLNRATESIARSTRVAVETEQIGDEIIDELGDQRESLVRTRDRLKDVDQDLSKSKRILNSMAIRIATNKLILLCIIIVELAILGAVVYIKFFKKTKKKT